MTAGSPAPVSYVEEREELAAVLRSPEFARAPRLAQLLEYLCEKVFSGETAQIKEYSVGVELFGRGDGFDQNADSIVRVEANRLRKRLADYYSGEGATNSLHIHIPVGQYVPVFQARVVGPPAGGLVGSPAVDAKQAPRKPASAVLRWMAVAGVTAVVVVIVAAVVWVRGRGARKAETAAVAVSSPLSLADAGIGVPLGDEVRILCGESRSLVDHAGKLWSADTDFTGGAAVKSDVTHIWRTQNPAFYRTSRQGDFRYDVPLKPGIYELRLHFAETEYGPESTGTGAEGNRIMAARVNGRTVLSGFDVAADAGASRTADVKVFPNLGPAADGKLHLEFAGEQGKRATLSAIEILPGERGRIRPIRVLARQTPYYSNDSQWWSPDNYFEGGQLATYTSPVNGTDDQELYESERWGNFSYAIPVAPGRYAVTIYFAARHGDWPPSTEGGVGAPHVFDVYCNGKVLLKDFDLAREARQNDVVMRRAMGLEPNAQGKLVLNFVPVRGYATVTGIEVVAQ
jgi:hypothetical protein